MRLTRTIAAAGVFLVALAALSGVYIWTGRTGSVTETSDSAALQDPPAPSINAPPQLTVPVPSGNSTTIETEAVQKPPTPEPQKPGTWGIHQSTRSSGGHHSYSYKPGARYYRGYSHSAQSPGTGSAPAGPVAPVDPVEEAVRAQAQQAQSSIEVDTNMQVGARYEARLLVQRGEAVAARSFMSQTREPTVVDQSIEVTQEAAARATSATLDITLTSPEWQTIRTNAPAVWTWTVVPTIEGAASMTITLSQKVKVDGEERIVTVEHYPQTIEVAIGFWSGLWRDFRDPASFVVDKWGSLAAIFGSLAVAAAAISALGRKLWRRAAARSPDQPVEPIHPGTATDPPTATTPPGPERTPHAGNGEAPPRPPPTS